MIACALFGIVAAAIVDFDLAEMSPGRARSPADRLEVSLARSKLRYSLPRIDPLDGTTADDGVRVKLRWRRVRVSIPFGSN